MGYCACKKDFRYYEPFESTILAVGSEVLIQTRISELSHKPVVELFYPCTSPEHNNRRIIHFYTGYATGELFPAINFNGDLKCGICHHVILTVENIKKLYNIYLYSNQFGIDSYLFLRESLPL